MTAVVTSSIRNKRILTLHHRDTSVSQIVALTGASNSTVRSVLRQHGLKPFKPHWERPELREDERNASIYARVKAGESLSSVGKSLGISRQRVFSIIRKMEKA